MSRRTHLWLRIGGIALILIAEFLPRLASHDASAQRQPSASKANVAALANR